MVHSDNRISPVVICFHFTIFVVLETTAQRHVQRLFRLWFAFILLSLSYWKQLNTRTTLVKLCCDLLSFYYLCRTGNNNRNGKIDVSRLWFAFILLSLSYWKQLFMSPSDGKNVVICFHFTIFVVLETTKVAMRTSATPLWFAFILLSLSYWKQLYSQTLSSSYCCDLLSFYYLCRTGNNNIAIYI